MNAAGASSSQCYLGAKRSAPDDDGERKEGAKRAAQACLQCRRRKLRCLGGWPCKRCEDNRVACDYERVGRADKDKTDGTVASAAHSRLQQLESTVSTLLAALAGSNVPVSVHSDAMSSAQNSTFPPAVFTGSSSVDRAPVDPTASQQAFNTMSSASGRVPSTVRFDADPVHQMISPVNPSPLATHSAPSEAQPSPGLSASRNVEQPTGPTLRRPGKHEKAAERLALATEGIFDPPFKALAYQPAVWENREASRRNSPERRLAASADQPSLAQVYDKREGKRIDDPVNTGIVEMSVAESLFKFYMDHCHIFLPIIDVQTDTFDSVRHSPPLFSAILAIAARFWNKFALRKNATPLTSASLTRLSNLADYHMGQTLLCKRHTLGDVQAVLLLAAWCLVGDGGGPDAWVTTGHAVRVARRLGVHRSLAHAAELLKTAQPDTDEWAVLEQALPQWRTWLAWLSFFSLGFGRPQSTHLENVDEQGLLRVRLSQPLPRPGSLKGVATMGDMYIASQVQLARIGRDLRGWGEVLTVATDDTVQSSATQLFVDLNRRLDEWSQTWIWTGAPNRIYLGAACGPAILQAEHMRLCVNSYALKYSPDRDTSVADCLKKAFNAAVSIIEMHHRSSQEDLSLSTSTDYLTITVAQAALFLIRMARAPGSVQGVVALDQDVMTHYVQMAIHLLEAGDMSETRLSTFLARTVRDIAHVAGVLSPTSRPSSAGRSRMASPQTGVEASTHISTDQAPPATFSDPYTGTTVAPPSSGFDFEAFLQLEAHDDFASLLGLAGDPDVLNFNYDGDYGFPDSSLHYGRDGVEE